MNFHRLFSACGPTSDDPYFGLEFAPRTVQLRDRDGSVLASYEDCVCPVDWSQTACEMLVLKYFRKAGVPEATQPLDDEDGVPDWLRRRWPVLGTPRGMEKDCRAVFLRLAGHWCYHGWGEGYFGSGAPACDGVWRYDDPVEAERNAAVFRDEILSMLARQIFAPASPQWFNTGLYWAYGIAGTDTGLHAMREAQEFVPWRPQIEGEEPRRIWATASSYVHPQLGACFIQSVEDTLLGERGIADLITRESRVFKHGGGSGTNVSELRGEGEPLSGGGKSSGLMSWLKIADRNAGAIKSGGTTRRAARMLVLDDDHPDLEEFVWWKVFEEQKVAALVAGAALLANVRMLPPESWSDVPGVENLPPGALQAVARAAELGYDIPSLGRITAGYEDEAYLTVSGQNANNSIRLTNAFMDSIRTDDDTPNWPLYHRTEKRKAKAEDRAPVPCKMVSARKLWRDIATAAWACADPGVQFHDRVNVWNGCIADEEIRATNPCCLVGSTLVDTSEGLISIARLVAMADAGDELPLAFAYDKESGRPVLRRITRAWKAGETRQLVRVRTDKGVTITATPEHRFLTYQGGYVRADNLRVGTSLRKIARHANRQRSDRAMISDKGVGGNGTEFQSRWMWEQAFGPIPDGCHVHHVNEDPTDDRLSNLAVVPGDDHWSSHAKGDSNPRWIDAADGDLLAVWDYLDKLPNKKRGSRFTPGRWNRAVRVLGLKSRVPVAATPSSGARIRGMTWAEFVQRMGALRSAANDRVVAIELVDCPEPVAVYDIEVDGVANFGVTDDATPGRHTIVVHNSEYNWLDDTSCNLASVNLKAFWRRAGTFPGQDKPVFECENYAHACRLVTVVLDISVGLAGYPTKRIAERSRDYRTIGLGYGNLGAVLMSWGIPYDSQRGRAVAACLTGIMHYAAASTSAYLARDLGRFPAYERNRAGMERVAHQHALAFLPDKEYDVDRMGFKPMRPKREDCPLGMYDYASFLASASYQDVLRFGQRNAQLTLCAPTGTIGLLMDFDTTGVEPDFALVKHKKLAGGGYMRLANRSVHDGMLSLGYTPEHADDVVRYVAGRGTLQGVVAARLRKAFPDEYDAIAAGAASAVDLRFLVGNPDRLGDEEWRIINTVVCGAMNVEGAPHLKPEHYDVFDCANKGGDGERSIAPSGHVLMLGAVVPVMSGSCSKTINLPAEATVQEIESLTWLGYRLGVKCLAFYRNGSKLSQPLQSGSFYISTAQPRLGRPEEDADGRMRHGQRRKLPDRRVGYTQKAKIGPHTVYVRTGEYPDGTLGEIFIDMHKEGAAFRSMLNCLAISVSLGLQYGVPLEKVVEAFSFVKFEPAGVVTGHDRIKFCTSIVDYIFREVAINYLGRDDLAHLPPVAGTTSPDIGGDEEAQDDDAATEDRPDTAADAADAAPAEARPNGLTTHMAALAESHPALTPEATLDRLARSMARQTEARILGYEGHACDACGSLTLRRKGTCLSCDSCGATSGCS